jgi:hypothetical protein
VNTGLLRFRPPWAPNRFIKAVYAARPMELRIAIRDGLLDPKTHRIMKMMASYVSSKYQIWPIGMDLEGALFEIDNATCQKIAEDVKTHFRRHLKYVEVECL